jgi:hypothetical protein
MSQSFVLEIGVGNLALSDQIAKSSKFKVQGSRFKVNKFL